MSVKRSALAAFVLGAALAAGAAHADFHAGGVGDCAGCHTMHNSLSGQRMTVKSLPVGQANTFLLRGTDTSSTCLGCHHTTEATPQTYQVSSPANATTSGGRAAPSQLTPGGDFGYTQRHNIVSVDFGYARENLVTAAPGGTYPRDGFSCISCHDPHGSYRHLPGTGEQARGGAPIRESGSYGAEPGGETAVGTYRLLAGVGYQPKALAGNYAFTSQAPMAVSPEVYNRSEGETDTRVAYGKGMSEWCGNCHGGMHSDQGPGPGNFRHPAGSDVHLGTDVAANYNRYDFRTGALDADGSAAYSSLVPFEMNIEVRADLLAATLSTAGPSAAGTESVSCVTCHRAHATAFPDMGRWRFDAVMLWDYFPSPIWYYGRTQYYFAAYQRSLCNKCHVRD
jgi:hypothetical protein